jgi:hypothetical protein
VPPPRPFLGATRDIGVKTVALVARTDGRGVALPLRKGERASRVAPWLRFLGTAAVPFSLNFRHRVCLHCVAHRRVNIVGR